MLGIKKGFLKRLLIRYGFAVCMVAAAFLLRLVLREYGGPGLPTYITFYPAVMVVAIVAGLWPGIAATATAALLVDYWPLSPVGSFGIKKFSDAVGLAFFSAMGLFMSLVAEYYRHARLQAQESGSELLRANEALEEARKYAESIVETVRECLVVLSADLRITSANRTFYEIFKVTPKESVGQYLYDLGNRQWDIPRLRQLLEDILPKNTKFENFEVDHEFPSIGRRTMLLNARRIYQEEKKTQMILLAIEDITKRKQAEEALKGERHRLYNVLETVPAMVCLLTPDYHVAFANRSFREKFGESGGRHCYEYCFGFTAPCDFCETYKVLESGKPHHWEVTSPDGNTIIDAHDFPFTDTDGSPLILEMDIDITAWRQAEEALKKAHDQVRFFASQCLTAQERERKLIAGEIHDSIGASLAATKFKMESALTEMGAGNPQARAALESVIPIIQGTIEEARRIQLALRPSMLDDLGILPAINWFCRQFETTYSDIRIEKEINIQGDEVPESLKIVIYRVLQEALNNVAKHSKASVVLLSLQRANQTIRLVVRDSGQGFDLEEAFFRKGTAKGLGLDSMRERAELSGGFFSIESSKGSGTVIRATWPLNS